MFKARQIVILIKKDLSWLRGSILKSDVDKEIKLKINGKHVVVDNKDILFIVTRTKVIEVK